ncbi:MAG: hypothetical protein ACR2QO_07380 [Acidimicrobiales bacterium]
MPNGDRRMELVGGRAPPQLEAGRLGLGLLVGLLAGHRALFGAASGRVAFEPALAYFVVTVLLSVGGALTIGVLYDRFAATPRPVSIDEETSRSEGSDDHQDRGVVGNRPEAEENHGAAG